MEGQLKNSYVLIDYENVQPPDLKRLSGGPFKVTVFLGPHQKKIPIHLASALQPLGTNARYVVLETSGANALDSYIAYHLGKLSCQDPAARFFIVSKDTDFDPLLKQLASEGIAARRARCIAEILAPEPALDSSHDAKIDLIILDLKRRNSARPRKIQTLTSTIRALFKEKLPPEELSSLIDQLCRRGIVRIEGAKVSYQFTGNSERAA